MLVGVLVAGCAQSLAILMTPRPAKPPMQFVVMPRDASIVCHGVVHVDGIGSVTVTVTVDGRTYVGRFSNHNTLLLSADNHELRCEMQDDGMENGVGICVDDTGRLYDALVRR
jgi:phosphatidylserine decarboxylase